MKISIKQNEDCIYFKDVYINEDIVGTVMANDKMTPFECYQSLRNNWEIDNLELENDLQYDLKY
jgi:hypothetical protein